MSSKDCFSANKKNTTVLKLVKDAKETLPLDEVYDSFLIQEVYISITKLSMVTRIKEHKLYFYKAENVSDGVMYSGP